jgi:hypothetical protein
MNCVYAASRLAETSTITRKLSKLAYALEDENRADLGVWHMKDLKEFRGSLAEAEEP